MRLVLEGLVKSCLLILILCFFLSLYFVLSLVEGFGVDLFLLGAEAGINSGVFGGCLFLKFAYSASFYSLFFRRRGVFRFLVFPEFFELLVLLCNVKLETAFLVWKKRRRYDGRSAGQVNKKEEKEWRDDVFAQVQQQQHILTVLSSPKAEKRISWPQKKESRSHPSRIATVKSNETDRGTAETCDCPVPSVLSICSSALRYRG